MGAIMRPPEFWYPENGRMTITAFFLMPFGWLYHLLGVIRRAVVRPYVADIPVICVGNLTAGGTGKTPMCLVLAEMMIASGRAPHFLMRGYGGSEKGPLQVDLGRHTAAQVGDEALLLATKAPTWVSSDRIAGAKAAALSGAGLIIMDDGFQNPSLQKAFSFVLVDGALGIGNGRVHPAGPLREFACAGLARADAVVITGAGDLPASCRALIERHNLPTFSSNTIAGEVDPVAQETGFVAFSGIGRPQKFFQTLADQGLEVREAVPYPDHHPFKDKDLEWLATLASEKQARLITTSKDLVRVPAKYRQQISVLPIRFELNDATALMAKVEEKLASLSQSPKTAVE